MWSRPYIRTNGDNRVQAYALAGYPGLRLVILVVDDRADRADRLKAMIEFMDAPNVVAASTESWRACAEGERLDAVFLGGGLDDPAVAGVLDAIADMDPNVSVVLLDEPS